MEPDALELYMALKDLCTYIATEIFPRYKDMYPGGVKEMAALDQELSEEAQPAKIRWFEKKLERLLKLQSCIASSASSSQRQAIYSLQFQAVHSLQFHALNITPQRMPMMCCRFL